MATAIFVGFMTLFISGLLFCDAEACSPLAEARRQMQPTPKGCVSTCMAILLDIPAEEVIKEFHDNYMSGHRDVEWYLARHGVKVSKMFTTDYSEKEGGLFLLSVPSLNIEAATHYVILDWRKKNGCVIFDPNNGKAGRKYYVCKWPKDLMENEYNLIGYSYDFRIISGV